MRKIIFFSVCFALMGIAAKSQNVQLHYDLGKDRKIFTSTIEMFKPDKWGSTFFFVDMDYGTKDQGGGNIQSVYGEIARSFKIKEGLALEPRVEYNGGLLVKNFPGGLKGFEIPNAWLVGVQYTFNNADFSKILTLQANYKYIKNVEDATFQITAVWGLHFLNRKLSITGFLDFWKEKHVVFDDNNQASTKNYVLLTEPQIWYKVLDKLSVGGEIEISNNFAVNDGFMVNPTIAVKWDL